MLENILIRRKAKRTSISQKHGPEREWKKIWFIQRQQGSPKTVQNESRRNEDVIWGFH